MFRKFDLVYIPIIVAITWFSMWYINTEHKADEPSDVGYIALAKANCFVVLFMMGLVVGGALILRLDARARARRMVRDALPSREDMVRQLTPRVRPLEDYMSR